MKALLSLALLGLPFYAMADPTYYCPQKHRNITLGMTPAQVIEACGQPLSKDDSDQPLTKKVPMQQLIYKNQGTETAFYGVWNIPTGSGGATLEIDVVNQRVKEIRVNGGGSNAASLCQGMTFQVGDQVNKVYGLCGSPSVINSTFINEIVPTKEKPQIWIYQIDEYQPPISLTFVDGKLQSINR